MGGRSTTQDEFHQRLQKILADLGPPRRRRRVSRRLRILRLCKQLLELVEVAVAAAFVLLAVFDLGITSHLILGPVMVIAALLARVVQTQISRERLLRIPPPLNAVPELGILEQLGRAVAEQRLRSAVELIGVTGMLLGWKVPIMPVLTGCLALLCALDVLLVHLRTRQHAYGHSPLELLELAEWLMLKDCKGGPPGGSRELYGTVITEAITEFQTESLNPAGA